MHTDTKEISKLPWNTGKTFGDIYCATGMLIGTFFLTNGNAYPESMENNAEYTIRAVNSHEALVSACQDALIAIKDDAMLDLAKYKLEQALALAQKDGE